MAEQSIKQLAKNRKAWHDYTIEETFEAGISLAGTEVKSIRMGTLNLKDSYCVVKRGEIIVKQMHVSPYEKGNVFNRDPMRVRKLLLKNTSRAVLLRPSSTYLKRSCLISRASAKACFRSPRSCTLRKVFICYVLTDER